MLTLAEANLGRSGRVPAASDWRTLSRQLIHWPQSEKMAVIPPVTPMGSLDGKGFSWMRRCFCGDEIMMEVSLAVSALATVSFGTLGI